MELSYRQTIDTAQKTVLTFLDEYRSYFEMYRVRGWIWSVFAPFMLFVPIYLWIAAFDHFSFTSVIQFGLSLTLLTIWICLPAIFLYINSNRHMIAKIWLWTWMVLIILSIVLWSRLMSGLS
jgi:hypothetical protein